MTTNNWREDFIDNIIRGGTHEMIIDHDRDLIMSFIETQIAQARREGRNELWQELLNDKEKSVAQFLSDRL